MKTDDINEIMECARALRASLSVPVLLDHSEALKLIVADLAAKYHHNAKNKNAEWTPLFKKVLSYYLSPDELAAITQANDQSLALAVAEKPDPVPCTKCGGYGCASRRSAARLTKANRRSQSKL
jgi:hypothetical protein